jgi:ferredoxin
VLRAAIQLFETLSYQRISSYEGAADLEATPCAEFPFPRNGALRWSLRQPAAIARSDIRYSVDLLRSASVVDNKCRSCAIGDIVLLPEAIRACPGVPNIICLKDDAPERLPQGGSENFDNIVQESRASSENDSANRQRAGNLYRALLDSLGNAAPEYTTLGPFIWLPGGLCVGCGLVTPVCYNDLIARALP